MLALERRHQGRFGVGPAAIGLTQLRLVGVTPAVDLALIRDCQAMPKADSNVDDVLVLQRLDELGISNVILLPVPQPVVLAFPPAISSFSDSIRSNHG